MNKHWKSSTWIPSRLPHCNWIMQWFFLSLYYLNGGSSFQVAGVSFEQKHWSFAKRSTMQWFVVLLFQAVVIICQAQEPNSEIKSIHLHFSSLTSEWKSCGYDIHSPRMCNSKMPVDFDAQSDTVWEQMHHTVCLASVVSVSGFTLCIHKRRVYICCHSPSILVMKICDITEKQHRPPCWELV